MSDQTPPQHPFTPGGWERAGAPSSGISEAPTMLLPNVSAALSVSRGFAQRLRERMLPPESPERRRIRLISLALLLLLGMPALLTLAVGAHDYFALKGLAQSGVTHITAAQSDLTGSSGNSGASSATGSGGSGSSAAILSAIRLLLATPGPDVSHPAYTYLAQRQGGTLNPLKVTVQPAKGVTAEGSSAATFQTTLTAPTYFALGGQPLATPTPTTTLATPTTTPAATASASSAHHSGRLPDAAHIAAAMRELRAAQSDFQSLSAQLDAPDIALALVGLLPVAGDDLRAAQALAHAGADATTAGVALLGAATPLLLRLHSTTSALTGQQKLLMPADITALQQAMKIAAARMHDASQRLSTVDVNALPLSARQKALFTGILPLLPALDALLPHDSDDVAVAGWLLGVDQPRHFLVQTLDRGEMRASGGFTGQYGVLTFDDAHMSPFSLQDVNCLDYLTGCLSNGWIVGRRPPAPYDSWWPFGDWGLRDANLSPDFPTNARLVTDVYAHESGQRVDGLINISPLVIEDVLRVTGPIQVPLYDETITADNLEAKLHYYQQDPAAIAKEQQLSASDTSTSGRKRFTQLVGQLLQERVKSLPMSEVAPLAMRMLLDLRSKDLEVYFADPRAEALLAQIHADGAVNTASGADGFLLAQSNVSVSKATNFVKVTQRDDVTLDAKGGATHHLTLTFAANYTYDQVYGYMTYRDYLRIYTPPQSQLLTGSGFDSGQPLCWSPYENLSPIEPAIFNGAPGCPENPYPNGELVCPAGRYAPGPQAPNVTGSDGYTPWALDTLGGPTNTTSDLPNRAMFAGFVTVPDYCTATVRLAWYTPGVAPKQ
ncbi:MAG TPA: DUF4012 domain-containing protein [Ktedonobacterales bacterium]